MTMKRNTIALWIIVILIAATIAILILPFWAGADGGGDVSLLKAAHNAYDEGDPDTPDAVFQEALDLKFYNVELDVMVDITHTTYLSPDHPDYLQDKVRLYVKHDCAPDPGTRDLYKYFEDLAAMVAANNNSVYGDGRNVILNIDVKPCNSLDYMDVAESLDALFDYYQGMLSYATIGDAGSFSEQAITVVLTSGDEVKDTYYNLINGGDKTLRAFKDRVVGGGDAYQNNVEDYFSGEADEYHRFYAMHWKHVEDGFPGGEGNWSQEDQDRLESLLSTALSEGFRIRFYALNGSPGSYQFDGGLGNAAQRWVQFVGANEGLDLRHFVATDDRQQITDLFNDIFMLPVRKLNGRVQRPDSGDQNGINPGIALADNRRIVEVHKSETNDYLWYSVGVVQSDWSIGWKTNARINVSGSDKQGVTPDVAISPIGPPVVVQVNKSQNNDYLWYNLGQLNSDNTVTWYTNGGIEVDGSHKQGVNPGVAAYGEKVIEVNKSQNNDNLWYNTGEISATQIIWEYNAQVDFQEGYDPDVALKGDRVIVVFEGTDSYLHYSTGTLGGNSIVSWEQTGDIGGQQGNNPTIALGSDGTVIEMHTSPTTSKIWVNVGELQWPSVSWKHNFVWDSSISATPRVALDANENLLIDVHKSGTNDGLWVNVGKMGISANSVVTYTIRARADASRITNLEEAARRLNAQLEAEGADYRVELQGELAGQTPDIIVSGHEDIAPWATTGYVISLTDYISLEWTSTYSDFYPALWDAVTWNGERWAVPQDTEARPVFFRKDILRDDLGWTDAQITQMVSDTLTGDFTLDDMVNVAQQIAQSKPVSSLLEANSLELLDSDALNFPTYHVQGLAVTEDIYYVTAIDIDNDRAWLFTVDRDTLALLEQEELTEGTLIHPGGIELDGTYLWIPNAEYDSDGPAKILALDPQSLEVSRTFTVSAHISLIASNGTDRLYGTDWASANFYVWDWDGNPIEIIASPTDVEYQDCQFVDPHLVCGGYEGDAGSIDVIDPASWTLVNRINVGVTSLGHPLTREGLSLLDGTVYLLPEDGPDSEVLIYQPTKTRWGLFHRPTAGPDFYIPPLDYGGTLYNPATDHLVLSECPTYRSLTFFYNLANVWHVTPMSMTTEIGWGTFHQTIVDGDVLFAFGGTWNWANWRDNYLGGNEQYLFDNVGYMLYPPARRGDDPITLSHPLVYMISSQSEHPDIAFQILTLASAPDLVAQYSVDSAHLAVRRAATQEPVYQADAFLQAVSYMLDYTTYMPNHEQEGEYRTAFFKAIQYVETGNMTPSEALNWLEADLQTTLGSELEIDTAPCFNVYLPLVLRNFGL